MRGSRRKSIPYEYIEVNPYHKPESLVSLNPRGLVPTLQYNNKPLYESKVVCEFLEEINYNHGLRLLPKNPYRRARVRVWINFVTTRIIPAFHHCLQFQSREPSTNRVRKEFLKNLVQFSEAMTENGPFFTNQEPTLIDFMMATWAIRLWVFDYSKDDLLPRQAQAKVDEKS